MKRETSDLEYKREPSKTYLKTVSAYANYGTGQILFGVDDEGNTVGLNDPKKACLSIEHAINDSMTPVPRFTLALDDETKTVTLTVFEGDSKPYLYKGKAYRRSDSSTVEVDRAEYRRLVLKGSNTTFDALESAHQSLSFNTLSAALIDKLGIKALDNSALVSLELKKADGGYTNAAALLADENSFFGIDIARFGDSINVILFRRTLERQSVLRQLSGTMSVFDDYYTYEEIIGFERVKKESVPREAFREAVANALVHRRWDVNESIAIRMFPDRIEVTSPGGLPNGMSEEAYLSGGPSIARNPILANLFFRLGYIERFGTGIPRIIESYADRAASPRFRIDSSCITVILPTDEAGALSTEERAILRAVPQGALMTRKEIEHAVGTSKDKTIRLINGLVEKGFIGKTGSGRATKYHRC